MTDVKKLLARQAAWQKGRKGLSWPEKIRMVEAIRGSVAELAASRPAFSRTSPPKAPSDTDSST